MLFICSVDFYYLSSMFVFFFFQAEDGIRDYKVTGVQTCALPIYILNDEVADDGGAGDEAERPKVYGDSAYGGGEFQNTLEDNDIDSGCKTQPPSPPAGGLFSKNRFEINLDDDTVTCPGQVTVTIRRHTDGRGIAPFRDACGACSLRSQCTNAEGGRTIRV